MNVYRLNAEIQTILSKVEEDGEIPSVELAEAIERLNATIPERIDTLYKVLRTAVATSTALRNEVQYTLGKARRWELLQETIKEGLLTILKVLGVQSFTTELCRPTICKGPPVVEVEEGYNLGSLEGGPFDSLVKKEYTLDAKLVKEWNKLNWALPEGVRVVEGKPYLRIL